MKICKYCHHESPDTAYYCFTCGQVLDSTPEPESPRPQEAMQRSPLPEQRRQAQSEETVPLSQPYYGERPTEPNPLQEPVTGPFPQAYGERPTEPNPPQRPVQLPLQKPSGGGVFDWVSSVLITVWLVIQALSTVLSLWVLPMLYDLTPDSENLYRLLQTIVHVISNLSYILPAIAVKKLPLRIVCIVIAAAVAGYWAYLNVMNYLNAPSW